MSFAPETDALAKPETLIRVPVGLASPLWGLFAGAAVTGATWWWMTRWTRPQNLEAMFGAAATAEAAPEAIVEPVVAVEAAAEAVVEPVLEAVAEIIEEAAPVPALETLTEATPDLEPLGGEAAPISPVLEALAEAPPEAAAMADEALADVTAETEAELSLAPKPKKKPAAPKAD